MTTETIERRDTDEISAYLARLSYVSAATRQQVQWIPAAEVTESSVEYTIILDMPGLRAADLHVACTSSILTVRGVKPGALDGEGVRCHLFERSYGRFERAFAFPIPVAAHGVVATLRRGTLTVHVPKASRENAERGTPGASVKHRVLPASRRMTS